jgi:hypothetical protein
MHPWVRMQRSCCGMSISTAGRGASAPLLCTHFTASGSTGLHEPSPGAPPVARGPSAARWPGGAATALSSTRLHRSPRFSHPLGFLPIFLPQARSLTGRATRNPLHGRGLRVRCVTDGLSLPSWSCGFDSRHPLPARTLILIFLILYSTRQSSSKVRLHHYPAELNIAFLGA